MRIRKLRTNRLDKPLGFQMDSVRVSYVVDEAKGKKQTAAQVIVSVDEDFKEIVYDSGVRDDIDSFGHRLPFELKEYTRYYWKVSVWTDKDENAESEPTWFETAKAPSSPWAGKFITDTFEDHIHPVFIKSIRVDKEVKKARAYATGLGIYEIYLNKSKVGDEYLLPGIHAYDSWLQYQTFELDLEIGDNLFEAKLGDGWYKSRYGLKSKSPKHDLDYAFIGEIHVEYEDGSKEVIGTDLDWQVKKGKVVFDCIYDGEIYDARIDDLELFPVEYTNLDMNLLEARLSPKISIHERIKPVEIIKTPAGETVLDFGQNMVGWVEFKANLPSGNKVFMQYGEVLQEGNFYNENLRTAKCEYTYISNGQEEMVRPYFTFYGFRYVKVEGIIGDLNPEDFTACVIHSELDETGRITTSNPQLNRLFENVRWSQKGNFLDTPTDCPQRDERMGWTGDAQIFSDTASFNMDTYGFFTKFGKDLWFEQKKNNGSVPFVVPMSGYDFHGATAWGDAATIIPWDTYMHFGDIAILEQQYESMKGWVDYIKREDDSSGGKRLWTTGKHFGDWLALDGKVNGGVYGSTEKYFIASAYYYYSTAILTKAAKVLGKVEEEKEYSKLANDIKEAFMEEFFTSTGKLSISTQTAYAVVIFMDLVPESARSRIKDDFKEKLIESGYLLNTGFVGTSYLCPSLSDIGLNDIAYKLLLNKEYPSWLYEVEMGGTTIWERWNSIEPDGKVSGTGMNSLNHYAYGSIASWMYRYMIGIRPVEEAPGFRKAIIKPQPNNGLSFAECNLDTPTGMYKVKWELKDDHIMFNVVIPFGAKAKLILPDAVTSTISTNAREEDLIEIDNQIVYNLDAGKYFFEYKLNKTYRKIYGVESSVREILEHEELKEIVIRHFPRILRGVPWQSEANTLIEILQSPFAEISQEEIEELNKEMITFRHNK